MLMNISDIVSAQTKAYNVTYRDIIHALTNVNTSMYTWSREYLFTNSTRITTASVRDGSLYNEPL